jgi:hypothetical protein
MSRPQPPGALNLTLQRGGSVLAGARPAEGIFTLDVCQHGGPLVEAKLNRAEFAALHAAMGELLAFYREEALDR